MHRFEKRSSPSEVPNGIVSERNLSSDDFFGPSMAIISFIALTGMNLVLLIIVRQQRRKETS